MRGTERERETESFRYRDRGREGFQKSGTESRRKAGQINPSSPAQQANIKEMLLSRCAGEYMGKKHPQTCMPALKIGVFSPLSSQELFNLIPCCFLYWPCSTCSASHFHHLFLCTTAVILVSSPRGVVSWFFFSSPFLECDASLSGFIQERAQKPCATVSPASPRAVSVTRAVEQNAQPVPEGGCLSNKWAPRLAGAVFGSSAVHVPSHPRGEQVSPGARGGAREAKWGLRCLISWGHGDHISHIPSLNLFLNHFFTETQLSYCSWKGEVTMYHPSSLFFSLWQQQESSQLWLHSDLGCSTGVQCCRAGRQRSLHSTLYLTEKLGLDVVKERKLWKFVEGFGNKFICILDSHGNNIEYHKHSKVAFFMIFSFSKLSLIKLQWISF